ncbi:50S ribosomal protein L3, chloroplastic [Selaginella moellendorffii]|nr:50S ribosomal protein L3, chloroplastic [Selaginella moellendorffii]|eukprot:XP_002992744.2 50S ribosomal protein L3, chloroplastic [Selaginella moellendorffii]
MAAMATGLSWARPGTTSCSARQGISIGPGTGIGCLRSRARFLSSGLQISWPPSSSTGSSSIGIGLTRRRRRSVIAMSYEAGIGVMGTKVGMMTHFMPDGRAIPVTVIGFHEGNIVTQVKTEPTDGYNAVQVGYLRVRDTKLTKPELGHLNKIGTIPMRHLQEFRLVSVDGFELSQRLNVEDIFKVGDLVDVSGKSIGKGFQGGIKRHNFKRGPMTHGSKSHRQLGSIGAGTTPGRVYPGKKMPGRMGFQKTKIRKLEIIKIDPELRAVLVKGAVPGKRGNLLRITPAKIVGKNIPKN